MLGQKVIEYEFFSSEDSNCVLCNNIIALSPAANQPNGIEGREGYIKLN